MPKLELYFSRWSEIRSWVPVRTALLSGAWKGTEMFLGSFWPLSGRFGGSQLVRGDCSEFGNFKSCPVVHSSFLPQLSLLNTPPFPQKGARRRKECSLFPSQSDPRWVGLSFLIYKMPQTSPWIVGVVEVATGMDGPDWIEHIPLCLRSFQASYAASPCLLPPAQCLFPAITHSVSQSFKPTI